MPYKSIVQNLSCCFPCYNEEENICRLIESTDAILEKLGIEYEIILVDDGSTDQTQALIRKLQHQYPRCNIFSQEHRGYGAALAKALEMARYDWVFFSDSDCQFDLNEIHKLLSKTAQFKVVLGYRFPRNDSFGRKVLQFFYKIWSTVLCGTSYSIKDLNCAFKLFERKILKQTFPLRSKGALINAEILVKVQKLGGQWEETPVRHFSRAEGVQTGGSLQVILATVFQTIAFKKIIKDWDQNHRN